MYKGGCDQLTHLFQGGLHAHLVHHALHGFGNLNIFSNIAVGGCGLGLQRGNKLIQHSRGLRMGLDISHRILDGEIPFLDDLVRAVKPVHNLAARFHVGGVGLIDLADGNGIAAGTAAGFDCMLAGNRHCEFENLVAVLCGKLLAVHKQCPRGWLE